jgi:pyridoxamine 5'-phosphate oxidase
MMHPMDQSDAASAGHSLPDPLPGDPMPLLRSWLDRACREKVQPNPNAFSLATIDPDGRPSVRVVLCKNLDASAGTIEFYTNYDGRKGRALAVHPEAAACFFWDPLDLQARVEGPAQPLTAAENDAYFASRPWASRIGAWASDQSRPIPSRAELLAKVEAAMRRFGLDPGRPPTDNATVVIPRPPHWGGYRLIARRVELWVSGVGRLHDRAEWHRELPPGGPPSPWSPTRLQP